jgi:hypothetical protein
MAYVVYREHTIVASASEDEITQQWLRFISISWMKDNGRLEVHSVGALERQKTSAFSGQKTGLIVKSCGETSLIVPEKHPQ